MYKRQGGMLYQRNDNGEHKVIAHVNRSLKGAERNYFTSEKEILAIVYCVSTVSYTHLILTSLLSRPATLDVIPHL